MRRSAGLLVAGVLLVSACGETPRVIGTGTPLGFPTAGSTIGTRAPTATATRSPGTTPSPARTGSPSPARSPSPDPSAVLPSQPPEPTVPPGASVVVSGEIRFALGPGQQREFDPVVLARDAGKTAPPCSSLFWSSAWHASQPLRATWIAQGARNDLGVGRWGTTTLGCSSLELRNEGTATVDARIVYTVASR